MGNDSAWMRGAFWPAEARRTTRRNDGSSGELMLLTVNRSRADRTAACHVRDSARRLI
jgi:hypothetical protein